MAQIKTGKVNVLGVDYNISVNNKENDRSLNRLNGYCDNSISEIVIRDDLMTPTEDTCKDMSVFAHKIVRHELIHAFMDESGITGCDWKHDESLVDWMAVMMPKMVKAMKDYL